MKYIYRYFHWMHICSNLCCSNNTFLFSTISLHGPKSGPTILLQIHTKNCNTSQTDTFCFIVEWSLLHKILQVLLKDCWESHGEQRVLGSRMWLSQPRLRTTGVSDSKVTPLIIILWGDKSNLCELQIWNLADYAHKSDFVQPSPIWLSHLSKVFVTTQYLLFRTSKNKKNNFYKQV